MAFVVVQRALQLEHDARGIQPFAGRRRGQQGGEIAQAQLRDVDDVEARNAGQGTRVPVDGGAPRGNRIHHAAMPAAVLVGHVEHVDDCVLDPKIDGLLQAPAHCSTQFSGRHVRGLDQRQLVAFRPQYRADRVSVEGGPIFNRRRGWRRSSGAWGGFLDLES